MLAYAFVDIKDPEGTRIGYHVTIDYLSSNIMAFARVGSINYGNFEITRSYNAGPGDLFVLGNLTVGGRIIGKTDHEYIAQLKAENAKLRADQETLNAKLSALETRVEQLWNAPGMPGAEMARLDFEETRRAQRPAQSPYRV